MGWKNVAGTFHIVAKKRVGVWTSEHRRQHWEMLIDILWSQARQGLGRARAAVIMSNHLHLLFRKFDTHLSAEPNPLIEALENGFGGADINQIHVDRVTHFQYYREAYRYIYRNPVEARLVDRAETYPFSSLRYVLDRTQARHPFVDDLGLITDPIRTLKWLNSEGTHRPLSTRWGGKM